jgi:predicted transcriptional regulator
VILAVLAERGPLSGRRVQSAVPRRQVDVRAALRKLEAAGLASRGEQGWVAS